MEIHSLLGYIFTLVLILSSTATIQMILLGVIFAEEDKRFWFCVYYVSCFTTGLLIGKWLF